ncbi:MAG: ABC transporter permease [Polyangiales bacterium]
MSAALLIARKDLLLVLRDRAGLFWIAAFPLLFALFLGAVMQRWSGDDALGLSIALTDADGSPESRAYVERLAATPALALRTVSLEQGRAALLHGEVDALVVLSAGFGRSPDWYAGGAEVIRVEADPSRRREAAYVKGMLLEAGLARAVEDELTADPRSAVRVVPLADLQVTPSPAELVTPAAVLWGLIGCAAAFAISLATERRAGTLRRLRSLPIGDFQVLAGKAIACWTACVVIAVVILVGALALFGVRLASVLGLCATVAALALCFTGVMATLSALGRSEQAVAGAGWGTLLVLGMLGGIMVPRMVMPSWLVSLGVLSPVRWGLLALEHALWRGGAVQDWALPALMLSAVGLFGTALGALLLHRSDA